MKFTEEHFDKITKIRNLCHDAISAENDIKHRVTDGTELIITGRAELAQSILDIMNGKSTWEDLT